MDLKQVCKSEERNNEVLELQFKYAIVRARLRLKSSFKYGWMFYVASLFNCTSRSIPPSAKGQGVRVLDQMLEPGATDRTVR